MKAVSAGESLRLGIDPDALNKCVQCGLCLPHCPTFRATGDESFSPRGRIALMRAVQNDGAPITRDVERAFETCVQCRGCETNCPSQVPYGELIEPTREALAQRSRWRSRLFETLLGFLARPAWLRAGAGTAVALRRMGLVPRRLGVPENTADSNAPIPATGDDVFLFTGCIMDAWQRDVHDAATRVLSAAGVGVQATGDAAPCCGALHRHAGLSSTSETHAEHVIRALSTDDRPILVDSAGCGAAMKEYGQWLGTEEARAFSARVFDIHEWLSEQLDRLPRVEPLDVKLAVQDPCHLRHVQKVHLATRTALAPFVRELVELDDEGLCCGAGGIYFVLEPELAGTIRERKCGAIERAGADVVVSANPGCSMHLAAAGLEVCHPMQIIDRALAGRTG
ncbi:MAG: (Fe-S)-binding protein [Myxococcota bacterium]|jgi:glycolate oxidase iron-sulfur subunit|nr:(Fe-S)-binding protein [Myxococcota bacterium]